MNFKQWLEYSDLGGEVSYNHMNNVVADDGFNQLASKYMAGRIRKPKLSNVDSLFIGRKSRKKMHR
jgi:hypothetical protein